MGIKEILQEAESIKPLGEINGVKITTFHDQTILSQADMIEGEVPSGIAQMNPDGTVARSNYKYASVNVDSLFENRFREIEEDGQKKLEVVVDYRACKEQSTGKIYRKTVQAFVVARKGKKLVIERVVLIPDDVFVKDFTRKLDLAAMSEILPLVQVKISDVTPTALTI